MPKTVRSANTITSNARAQHVRHAPRKRSRSYSLVRAGERPRVKRAVTYTMPGLFPVRSEAERVATARKAMYR